MSVYLDQFARGWRHTSIYLLRDRTDEGGNQTFGFYRPDYSPRPAATNLHNLTTILADEGAIATPGTLAYTIPNEPATVHDMLLQKSDGTFELVVWGERFTGGSDTVTVNLGATVPKVLDTIPPGGVLQSTELDYTLGPVVLQGVTMP